MNIYPILTQGTKLLQNFDLAKTMQINLCLMVRESE